MEDLSNMQYISRKEIDSLFKVSIKHNEEKTQSFGSNDQLLEIVIIVV